MKEKTKVILRNDDKVFVSKMNLNGEDIMSNFQTWFQTFIEEKEIDLDRVVEFENENGLNLMPVGCVVEAVMVCSKKEQEGIKSILVKIDFMDGDVSHFFNHLAQGLAASA